MQTGAKVTWNFEDSVQHNVTADDEAFHSDDLNKGGSYSYTCTIHPQMQGSVTVK